MAPGGRSLEAAVDEPQPARGPGQLALRRDDAHEARGFVAGESDELHGGLGGDTGLDDRQRQAPGQQRAGAVGFPEVLAAERGAADGHARAVVVQQQLLARQAVVALGPTDGEGAAAVDDEGL